MGAEEPLVVASVLDLVEDPLGDLALADLAPLPVTLPDQLVEMLQRLSNRAEPDLGLGRADALQLGAAGEVQQVRRRAGRLAFAVGIGEGPVENEADGFQPRLEELVGSLELTNPGILLDRHEGFPNPSTFYISSIK